VLKYKKKDKKTRTKQDSRHLHMETFAVVELFNIIFDKNIDS
jgi:hypothetical protein